jgi:integrase
MLPTDSSQSTEQFLATWLDSVKASLRPRTYEAYNLNVRRLLPLIGSKRLKNLTPQLIERAYSLLLESGLSKRSVEQAHAVLHSALEKALHWDLIARNPADFVSVPRPERREMKTLTREQAALLIRTTRGDRLEALWVLLLTTGMRLGEALGLRWDDLDMNARILRVSRALQRQAGKGLVMAEPKTSRSRRTIHLSDIAVSALQDLRKAQLEDRPEASPPGDECNLVFTRADGSPIDPGQVSAELKRALQKAGLPRIRVHDLRHTAASLLLANGTHPKVVQDLLGHSTISLTLDTYSHVSPALHAQVAADMQEMLVSREPPTGKTLAVSQASIEG